MLECLGHLIVLDEFEGEVIVDQAGRARVVGLPERAEGLAEQGDGLRPLAGVQDQSQIPRRPGQYDRSDTPPAGLPAGRC